MNRYLLLRDNKQSGPYTVPEIIAKGIKPYDLVWLDGKSAAWRYPSEIEELKAHSPVVEEQPFDRFYKKPEFSLDVKPIVTEAAEASIVRFQPKVSEPKKIFEPVPVPEPISRIDHTAVKKVYINFPGAVKRDEKVVKNESKAIAPKEEKPVAPYYQDELINESHFSNITPTPTRKKASDKKIFYAVVAACFVLVMVIGALIVNYMNQRSNLDHLNLLVQQMEQRQKEKQGIVPALQNTPQVTPAVVTPAIIIPAAASTSDYNVQENAPPKTIKKSTPLAPLDPSIKFTPKQLSTSAGASPNTTIAETENKAAVKEVSNENLFSLVSLKSNKFKTGLLGGISNLQLELTNNSNKQLHKVAVEIKFLGVEKKVVKTQTVYFENVSPGMQTTIDVPRSNRGVTVSYTVTDIKS